MSIKEVLEDYVNKFEDLNENEWSIYNTYLDIRNHYNDIYKSLNDDMKLRFNDEYEILYNQYVFGDGDEYDILIIKDFLSIIREIISYLNNR